MNRELFIDSNINWDDIRLPEESRRDYFHDLESQIRSISGRFIGLYNNETTCIALNNTIQSHLSSPPQMFSIRGHLRNGNVINMEENRMTNVIVESRRELSSIIEAYTKYKPGGVKYPCFYAYVKYNYTFKGIKAISETAEHDGAAGEFISVSRTETSSVVYFELAPKYGRLWHENHLIFTPSSNFINNSITEDRPMPQGMHPPIAYVNSIPAETNEIDPLSHFRRLYHVLRPNMSLYINNSDRSFVYFRMRTPEEFAAAAGMPEDHEIINHYRNRFPSIVNTTIPKTKCIFTTAMVDYNMRLNYLGRDLARNSKYYSSEYNNSGYEIPDSPDMCITMVELNKVKIIYPGEAECLINELRVPFASLDFSVSEFIKTGAAGFVTIIVPEAFPPEYHYPYIWNLMVGERISMPYKYTDHTHMHTRIYTPDGNSVPSEYFEILE